MNFDKMNLTSERQFFLWNVIGPLLALATVFLMLVHPTPLTPLFALTMVFGLPACWYLKKWGVIVTACVLTFLIFFNTNAIAEAPIWHFGMTLSILLTLFVTTNSFEEGTMLVEEFSGRSASIQKTIEQYKSDLENLKFKHQNELHAIQNKIEANSKELTISQEKSIQLMEAVENAQSAIQMATKEAEQAKNEATAIRGQLEAKAIKEEHVLQELLEKRKEVFQLRDLLQESQDELKSRHMETGTRHVQDDGELQNLRDLISKKDQDLFNIQFRLDSALEDIQEQGKELSKIQDKEILQKKLQLEMSDQIETLKREKELLELTIHKLQHETEQFSSLKHEKEKLENSLSSTLEELENIRCSVIQAAAKEVPSIPNKETTDTNFVQEYSLRRRAEGMYLQLKDQFNEKSATLDEARRQLFHTQESLMQLQRNLKEREQFGTDPQVQSLTRHILKMQNQCDLNEKFYNTEIDILQEIITKLSR